MPRAPIDAELNALFNPAVEMRPAWTTKKKKIKKKIFFRIYQYTNGCRIVYSTINEFPQTLPVLWLNQATHRNAKGTIECRIECSIQPWGQNEDSLTIKKKKNEKKKDFSASISTIVLQFPQTLPVLWLNQATHRNAKRTIECRIECSNQPWDQNEASLITKKKKKRKKRFFKHYISTSRVDSSHKHCLFLWLNQATHRNAKGTIECRIECSIQPWGQNEASLTIKKKKKMTKNYFFVISQQ